MLFTSSTHGYNYDDADVIVYSTASGQRKTVQNGGNYARYLPRRSCLYPRGALFVLLST